MSARTRCVERFISNSTTQALAIQKVLQVGYRILGQAAQHGFKHGAVVGHVVATDQGDRACSGVPAGHQAGHQLARCGAHCVQVPGADHVDVGGHVRIVGVELALFIAEVAGLRDRHRDDAHLGIGEISQQGGDVGSGVGGGQRTDHPVLIAFGADSDQGVQVVLALQLGDDAHRPSGEGGNAPLVGVAGPVGVPGLVRTKEVA